MDKLQKESFLTRIIKSLKDVCDISDDVALYVACQSALETSFGCSELAYEANNYFGMRCPQTRVHNCLVVDGVIPKYTTLKNGSFAVYLSLDDSVIDYIYRSVSFGFNNHHLHNLYSFKQKLSSSYYCPDKNYIASIDALYNQFTYLLTLNY